MTPSNKPQINRRVISINSVVASCALLQAELLSPKSNRAPLAMEALPRTDWQMLMGYDLWLPSQRHAVKRCLIAVRDGLCEILGHDPIRVSIEYQTAIIFTLVQPHNYRSACHWMAQESLTTDELANGDMTVIGSAEVFSASQIFAQLQKMHELGHGDMQQRFYAKWRKYVVDVPQVQSPADASSSLARKS